MDPYSTRGTTPFMQPERGKPGCEHALLPVPAQPAACTAARTGPPCSAAKRHVETDAAPLHAAVPPAPVQGNCGSTARSTLDPRAAWRRQRGRCMWQWHPRPPAVRGRQHMVTIGRRGGKARLTLGCVRCAASCWQGSGGRERTTWPVSSGSAAGRLVQPVCRWGPRRGTRSSSPWSLVPQSGAFLRGEGSARRHGHQSRDGRGRIAAGRHGGGPACSRATYAAELWPFEFRHSTQMSAPRGRFRRSLHNGGPRGDLQGRPMSRYPQGCRC